MSADNTAGPNTALTAFVKGDQAVSRERAPAASVKMHGESCARCADLEEQIAYLRSELGLQHDNQAHRRVRDVMLTRNAGGKVGRSGSVGLVMALYGAKGRPVTRWQLLETVASPSGNDERLPKIIDVWVCYARKTLGHDAIANVWGKGYCLTSTGMERVRAIIEGPTTPPTRTPQVAVDSREAVSP
jgi:hypothetical protein